MVVPVGTCYEEAWRFLIKEEEGELIHGTVESLGRRIGHAWVELPTGYIWEPQTKSYFSIKGFDIAASPIEEHRYTIEEAAIMLSRVGKHGPWTKEEKEQFLKGGNPEEVPAVPEVTIEKGQILSIESPKPWNKMVEGKRVKVHEVRSDGRIAASFVDKADIKRYSAKIFIFEREELLPKPPAVEVPAVPGVGIIHKTNPIEDVAAIRSGERLFAEQGEGVFLLALGVKTVPKNLVIEKIGDGSEVLYLQSQADEVAPIIKRLKEMAGTPATAEKIIERGRLFGYSEADINAFLAEQGLRPPAVEVPAVPEVEREAKIKYFRQQETKWRETAYKIAKEERGEAPFAEAIRKADEFGRQATELEAIPKLPAVKAEEWKLREAIAATAYGLAYGVKEEDLRKHLTRNPRAKYWFEPEDVDYILERAKLPKIIREAEEYFRRPPGRPPEELMPEGSNPMGKVITKEEAIGLLERLSMTPGEAARSLVAGEAERREIMQTVQQRVKREQNKWAPMDPREGPPLPRIFAGLRWPWKR